MCCRKACAERSCSCPRRSMKAMTCSRQSPAFDTKPYFERFTLAGHTVRVVAPGYVYPAWQFETARTGVFQKLDVPTRLRQPLQAPLPIQLPLRCRARRRGIGSRQRTIATSSNYAQDRVGQARRGSRLMELGTKAAGCPVSCRAASWRGRAGGRHAARSA